MKIDTAPVEFLIKVDGKQISSYETMMHNTAEIEKKLKELMRLFHPELCCSFCAAIVPDGVNFELEGFGEFPSKRKND